MDKMIYSSLKLEKLVFDKILFDRVGFKNDSELELEMEIKIGEDHETYRVSLILRGTKEKEYHLEVGISGFFTLENLDSFINKEELLEKNAVAILMPYLRSQVSLITTQPDTEPVVLPILNINNLMKK